MEFKFLKLGLPSYVLGQFLHTLGAPLTTPRAYVLLSSIHGSYQKATFRFYPVDRLRSWPISGDGDLKCVNRSIQLLGALFWPRSADIGQWLG